MTAGEEKKPSKRKRDAEFEEIEIDVNLPEPLSKKAQRSRKKSSTKSTSNDDSSNTNKPNTLDKTQSPKKKQQSDYGVWIGNLSFNLNKDDLRRFFVSKSISSEGGSGGIKSEEIIRVHLPKKAGGQNKGFAYVDFDTEAAMLNAIALSETPFEGRKVLIKDARVFDGSHSTGSKVAKTKSGKPPTKILFVGNLPFETKETDLQENDDGEEGENFFEIIKPCRVRMATFQDSGNCKGFAFIDYASSDEAEKALSVLGSNIKILGRKGVKVEFGEDRSFRWKNKQDDESHEDESAKPVKKSSFSDVTEKAKQNSSEQKPSEEPARKRHIEKKIDANSKSSKMRITPGMALANSQRQKVSIVPSEGKKIVFTD
ncbi:hypothetical protein LIPSTDRAFT_49605 [Lipomyces starkeyi NRRL Y-11557]|uniref:RRM domain-containing protein n=1 Tax=Lipomyces starkeyi NRRL Y-11557 TaxID=675824 RepID=A0A1E3QCK4_LIPST|nr:hypothetical protein LIPSTDRAFT_49605 [Lipomyces starkeyi NRRL Y-11557]